MHCQPAAHPAYTALDLEISSKASFGKEMEWKDVHGLWLQAENETSFPKVQVDKYWVRLQLGMWEVEAYAKENESLWDSIVREGEGKKLRYKRR